MGHSHAQPAALPRPAVVAVAHRIGVDPCLLHEPVAEGGGAALVLEALLLAEGAQLVAWFRAPGR
eukprot:CAMPEP_0179220746 /NCGR_PEP_ID=MMETSP0797-20121207/5803_1 /TAXON_ID=47934 /ORGANISM="Dinophysis acuminata, Strain DAEP01" /LENGTH=64 /DNA_ID=CAMNT_0020927445 /DNA_START=444 /DNA_END=634 /DNA_ORIENTATION=+